MKTKQYRFHKLTLLAGLLMSLPVYAAPNIFADVPLVLQNKKTTTPQKVKPNLVLAIDNNTQMLWRRKEAPNEGVCAIPQFGGYPNTDWTMCTWFASKQDLIDRVEKDKAEGYKNGYSYPDPRNGGTTTRLWGPANKSALEQVQEVTKLIINKYRNDIYFSLAPFSDFNKDVSMRYAYSKKETDVFDAYFKSQNVIGTFNDRLNKFEHYDKYPWIYGVQEDTRKKDHKYMDLSDDQQLKMMLNDIDKLNISAGTDIFPALPKIFKHVVMKGQKYRCQRSYVILLTNGYQITNNGLIDPQVSDTEGVWYDRYGHFNNKNEKPGGEIFDGYFDSNRRRSMFNDLPDCFRPGNINSPGCEYARNQPVPAPVGDNDKYLGYFTNRLATKNFGHYIYQDDYYQACSALQSMGWGNKGWVTIDRISGSQGGHSGYDLPTYQNQLLCTGRTDPNPLTQRPRRLTDDAGKAWDSINPLTGKPYTQIAETFTVGMDLKRYNYYDPNNPRLERDTSDILFYAATPAGTGKHDPISNPDGRFFDITADKASVLATFENILEKIVAASTAIAMTETVASTVGISSTTEGDTSFTAKVDTSTWSSQICIHNRGDDPNSCSVQPTYQNRQLVVNDGKQSYLYSTDSIQSSGMSNATFKIRDVKHPNAQKNLTNAAEWHDGLLTWMARAKEDSLIRVGDNDLFVLNYRDRQDVKDFGSSRNIGDILNNPLLSFGDALPNARHQKYLITSSNDGLVYVFGATNDNTKPYDLKFNYMPLNMQRQSNDNSDLNTHYFKDLTDNEYGQFSTDKPHRYLLNGGMIVQQTDDRGDGIKQTFMVSTMGQGGRGAFAINIGGKDILTRANIGVENMNSPDWYKNLQLFRTEDGINNKLGYTVGTPAVARIRVNYGTSLADTKSYKHNIVAAAFISNGYNYTDTLAQDTARKEAQESALYVYNILGADVGTDGYKPLGNKGDLIKKIIAVNGKGGLSSPTAFDIDGDNIADIVYAGDYAGNMFRFDIRNPDPSTWKGVKIFSAHKPITTAPLVVKADREANSNAKLIVVFGTGSDIYEDDLENVDQQTIYGIYDDYELADGQSEVFQNDLLEQRINISGQYRTISKNKFDQTLHKGWYINLDPQDGERVVSNFSRLLTTGIIPTRIYSIKKGEIKPNIADPCTSLIHTQDVSAKTRLIQFNLRTGSGLSDKSPHIVFDKNNPLGIVTKEGLTGFEILSEITQNIGATGNWRPLGETPPSPDSCMEKLPVVATTEGLIESEDIQNVLCAKDKLTFKRLAWREVKEAYNS